MKKIKDLNHFSESQLLSMPLSRFSLSISSSPVALSLKQLQQELDSKKIPFRVKTWISTDWFCPDGSTGFAIPFYMLHPRLKQLEKKYIHQVEGGTKSWCMQILRHEVAHALDNAFHLRKLKMRQQLFGLTSMPYPKEYKPDPISKDYVLHLEDFYAQSHPDEDWAETFAVWLDPKSDWQNKYESWPCLEKLNYLDSVMTSLKKVRVQNKRVFKQDEISTLDITLEEYFQEKMSRLKLSSSLKSLKSSLNEFKSSKNRGINGPYWLRKNKKHIYQSLRGENKINERNLEQLFNQAITICGQEKIRFPKINEQKLANRLAHRLKDHFTAKNPTVIM